MRTRNPDFRVPATKLVEFMDKHNLSTIKAAEALRTPESTIRSFLNNDDMPKVILTAIEGVERRFGQRNANRRVMLCTVPGDQVAMTRKILGAMGINCSLIDIEG